MKSEQFELKPSALPEKAIIDDAGIKRGGDLVVEQLVQAGVTAVFGLHGAHLDPIFQACRARGIRVIDTRHEASAGHAAEGYARVAKRLGVVLVTAGGGFTNAVTSMANALLDRTPVLYFTSSAPQPAEETNTLQAGFDQVAVATPITKWAYRVARGENIPRIVAQAIRIATASPPGPVMIDIAMDLLAAPTKASEAFGAKAPLTPTADGAAIDQVLNLIESAERPLILIGSEAARGDAPQALRRLIDVIGVPVLSDYSALGVVSRLDEANGAGLVQALTNIRRVGAPDMILMLGLRFGMHIRHGSGELVPHEATVVQVDPDAREIGRLQQVALGIEADVSSVVVTLADRASRRSWPDRSQWRQRVTSAVQERLDFVAARAASELGDQLHPFVASSVLADWVDTNTTVVADGALTYHWLSEVIGQARPNAFLTHGFLGTMGCGFGVAIGAAVADAEHGRRTVLVTGDGSVGYSLADFDTLVRHDIPLIVVVMNNRSWGATQHFQEMTVGRDRVVATPLNNGDYQAAASAFGALGISVTDEAGLRAALNQAAASGRPACLDVRVDLAPVPPEEWVMMGVDPFSGKDDQVQSIFETK